MRWIALRVGWWRGKRSEFMGERDAIAELLDTLWVGHAGYGLSWHSSCGETANCTKQRGERERPAEPKGLLLSWSEQRRVPTLHSSLPF